MTDHEQWPERAPLHLEIPIEPLPTGPLVPRPAPTFDTGERTGGPQPEREPSGPLDRERREEAEPPTQALPAMAPDVDDPTVEFQPQPPREAARPREREEAGRGALRPATPRPAPTRASEPSRERPARFSDPRHPFRAAFGLIFLVMFGALALAAAIGAAIALIAFAVRRTVG